MINWRDEPPLALVRALQQEALDKQLKQWEMEDKPFTVEVIPIGNGYQLRLINPSGSIFMSRLYKSMNDANDEADRLIDAWGKSELIRSDHQ